MIKDIIGPHRRLLLTCIAASLVVYIVAAWRSAIYIHPDEYYQIIEFASYKMGITQAGQMAWEFAERIRPAAQPLLCYALLRGFDAVSLTDHYSQLFALRVLSGCLSLLSIAVLCISALPSIRARYRAIFIAGCFFFWYPYTYGVHFSSEAWSGCMVMIVVSMLVLYYHRRRRAVATFMAAGAVLGLAFLFRFQTAFITLGLLGWLWFIRGERRHLLYLITTGLLILGAGTAADRWLYGEWVFVPLRYFDAAFIHQHADFGDQPLYYFPQVLITSLTPPLGVLALVALPVAFITQPRSIYTWALLPFLIVHLLIPHKEWRFLFPILGFVPLLIVLAWQGWTERSWPMHSLFLSVYKWVIVLSDLFALIVLVCLADVRFDQKVLMQKVHAVALQHPVVLYESNIAYSPFVLPKATIPRDLYPEYLRDQNVREEVRPALHSILPAGGDTVTLISTTEEEWDGRQGTILYQTWPGSARIHRAAGAALHSEIASHDYYLIRYEQ